MSEPGKPSVITIPNALSFYRLLSFPFLLFLVFTHREHWFSILFCINLVTDILDGLIARLFRMTTALGAKLDSLADAGMYILAFFGI
ncbi:MAG TPA: CDP-alcohol phosphatidyltransferase family protein, partial [Bacteroidia bacterium]|nr:CDP-alcohol phosphatidyltransferase family protein [Bacteroidia bacterium]